MKPELLVTLSLALCGGCFVLATKYPRVCIDVFETLNRIFTQLLMALLFFVAGHVATRYIVSKRFETVTDGRVSMSGDSPEAKATEQLAEHAEFALSRMQSAIAAANDYLLQWLAISAIVAALLLLLFTSCIYLAKKVMEHGYALPPQGAKANDQPSQEARNSEGDT